MALATSCYVRDTALKFAQQGVDITQAALKNWSKNSPAVYISGISKDKGKQTWTQDLGEHGQQDLTWLL